MDFFILYMALPALFYRILAKTPFEQLNNVPFIVTTTLATFLVLCLSFAVALAMRRDPAESTIGALAGAYGNIGYMGPGLALATLGARGGGAGRADLLLRDAAVLFAGAVPDGDGAAGQRWMARSRPSDRSPDRAAIRW